MRGLGAIVRPAVAGAVAGLLAVGLACAGPFDGGDDVLPPLTHVGGTRTARQTADCSPWTRTCDGNSVMVCEDGRYRFVEDCSKVEPAGTAQCVQLGYDAECTGT